MNLETISDPEIPNHEAEGEEFFKKIIKSVNTTLRYATMAFMLSNMMPAELNAGGAEEKKPDAFTSLVESKLGNICQLQVESQNGKMIVHIAQAHAYDLDGPVDIEKTAVIQKRIEGIILKLEQVARDSHKKVTYFVEGNTEGNDSMMKYCEGIDSLIPTFFSNGVEETKEYEQHLMSNMSKISLGKNFLPKKTIETGYLESMKYAFWIRLSHALNEPGFVSKDTKEQWKTAIDEELSKINMAQVYYVGAMNKLVCEGCIKGSDYKKTEDRNILEKDFSMIGLGKTLKTINKFDEHEKVVKEREDAVISNIAKEMQGDTGVAVLVFGAAHDFEDNVISEQKKEKTPGLLRINVITSEEWKDINKDVKVITKFK